MDSFAYSASMGCGIFIAYTLSFIGETKEAIRLLNIAFRLNPVPPTYYYHFLGMAYRNDSQYEKAIALDPLFPAPHKAMGLMHYKEGERLLAQKFFESCLLLSPDAPDKAHIQGYLQRCINNGEES